MEDLDNIENNRKAMSSIHYKEEMRAIGKYKLMEVRDWT